MKIMSKKGACDIAIATVIYLSGFLPAADENLRAYHDILNNGCEFVAGVIFLLIMMLSQLNCNIYLFLN